jgi:hypothetical protein
MKWTDWEPALGGLGPLIVVELVCLVFSRLCG